MLRGDGTYQTFKKTQTELLKMQKEHTSNVLLN